MRQVQTSPPGTFPTEFGAALAKMRENAATMKFPFGSLVPLWSRQIPYTMAKFYFFEKVSQGSCHSPPSLRRIAHGG